MPTILLKLHEPDKTPLNDQVDVTVFDCQAPHQHRAIGFAQDTFKIDVPMSNTTIRILVSSSNHQDVERLTFLNGDLNEEFAVPVNPVRVLRINGPAFGSLPSGAQKILTAATGPQFAVAGVPISGPALYDGLDLAPLLKAGLLNIVAKAAATRLGDHGSVLDSFTALRELRQDRFFAEVDPALIGYVAQSNAFHSVSDALHEPLPGYQMVSSYKTYDRYGNLQLTFQRSIDGTKAAADVDIDDAQGLAHWYQVIRNDFTGATNPYDIHEILLGQNPAVDPRYEFVFEVPATPGATTVE